jgi:hypothetical protein
MDISLVAEYLHLYLPSPGFLVIVIDRATVLHMDRSTALDRNFGSDSILSQGNNR